MYPDKKNIITVINAKMLVLDVIFLGSKKLNEANAITYFNMYPVVSKNKTKPSPFSIILV
ncbi:hypothetical protein rsdtw13_30560 [Clostridium sp. TW13]|uniref:Uncharacterized protein n=1 Tax=Inconstantimicrobium mannanitabidum TaxID=1604901 RepID=A0ACB5RF85_9CLOT|nr:hypothetical protein rsdtw13_30560 [Clostridium sp. TW13]